MSTVGSFDRFLHFSELNSPLFDQTGVLSPSIRKQRAALNLGLTLDRAVGGADVFRGMPVPAAVTDTATLTTAQLLAGNIQGTPTAAANYTLPLATAMDTALSDFEVGDAVEFSIVNQAVNPAFDITIVTNTGWTLSGAAVVIGAGANDGTEWKSGIFRARKTATGAWTLYRVA